MLQSCHIRISEWIHTLYLPESQINPYSKQAGYLNFEWLQRVSKSQPLSSSTNTQPFGQTDQMIELNCEYLSIRWIWLYVLLMSPTRFRVNRQCTSAWISGNYLLETVTINEVQVTATGLKPTATYFENHSSSICQKWPNYLTIHLNHLAKWLNVGLKF